jgi:hypothetical protein
MFLCVLTKVAFKKVTICDYGESLSYITKLTFENPNILKLPVFELHTSQISFKKPWFFLGAKFKVRLCFFISINIGLVLGANFLNLKNVD